LLGGADAVDAFDLSDEEMVPVGLETSEELVEITRPAHLVERLRIAAVRAGLIE
jgi:hypothetical protein